MSKAKLLTFLVWTGFGVGTVAWMHFMISIALGTAALSMIPFAVLAQFFNVLATVFIASYIEINCD